MQDGTVIPVQVDAQGRLVAEGLQGVPGPAGPAGPPGGSFELPSNPQENDTLVWKNGTLRWSSWKPPGPDPSTIVWANPTPTADGFVVPNGGTPYWTDVVPPGASLDYNEQHQGLALVHDASDDTHVYWVGNEYGRGNVSLAWLDLRDLMPISSIELLVATSGFTGYKVSCYNSARELISGTVHDLNAPTKNWISLPTHETARFLEFDGRYGTTGVRLWFYGIKVNGTRLINAQAS